MAGDGTDEVGTGPDKVDHTRELEVCWVGSGEPLKMFEQERNRARDQFEKMTLATAWGMDWKGEPGGRVGKEGTFNPEEL